MKIGRVARWSAWGIVGIAGVVLPLVTMLFYSVGRQEQIVAARMTAIQRLEWIDTYARRLSTLRSPEELDETSRRTYAEKFALLSRDLQDEAGLRDGVTRIGDAVRTLETSAGSAGSAGTLEGLLREAEALEQPLWTTVTSHSKELHDRWFILNFLALLSCALAVTLALLLFAYERSVEERRKAEEGEQELREELAHVGRLSVVGEMGTKIAHELNQPLGAIQSYVAGCVRRLQRRENVPPEVIDALQQAMRETERASAIIRGLREFGRHSEDTWSSVEVNDLVREILPLLSAELRESRIEPELDLAEGLERVQADRIQIEQVLVNLVRNSIEAMSSTPAHERRLIIRTSRAPDRRIEVQVEDTGCGISADLLPNLFQPFHSTKPKGMGIGLAISRTIVEAHEGTIRAEPRRGRGALFRFQLPCPSMVVTA